MTQIQWRDASAPDRNAQHGSLHDEKRSRRHQRLEFVERRRIRCEITSSPQEIPSYSILVAKEYLPSHFAITRRAWVRLLPRPLQNHRMQSGVTTVQTLSNRPNGCDGMISVVREFARKLLWHWQDGSALFSSRREVLQQFLRSPI